MGRASSIGLLLCIAAAIFAKVTSAHADDQIRHVKDLDLQLATPWIGKTTAYQGSYQALESDSTGNAAAVVRRYHEKESFLWIAVVNVADMVVKPTVTIHKKIPAEPRTDTGIYTATNPKVTIRFLQIGETKGFLYGDRFFRKVE